MEAWGLKLCTFPACENPHLSGGLCDAHRKQKQGGKKLRPLRGTVTPDSLDLAKQLHAGGATLAAIGNRLGVSLGVVRRWLLGAGVKMRAPGGGVKRTSRDLARARRLYEVERKSPTEIGRMFGVSAGAVYEWSKKQGWKMRTLKAAQSLRRARE